MFDTPRWADLASRRRLIITDRRQVGVDARITAEFAD
jgi:hypothetical protein